MPTTAYTTTGWHIFTVPNRVTSLTVSLDGAGSGTRGGGRVTGKLAVKAGQRLYCYCGVPGKANVGATGGAATGGAGGRGGTGRSKDGGDSGGGYSIIRLGSSTGTIKAVAGGAGGTSGDGGLGGLGGGTTGGSGGRGTAGTNATGAATGGTTTQGGNGGTSSAGTQYNGANAADAVTAVAGAGGTAGTTANSHGGGGGGGGYHPGGGGQASAYTYAPGGGGGGGSSYWGGLTGAAQTQGLGGVGNGSVSLTWVTPPPGNQPPTTPSEAKVNGVPEVAGMMTKATTKVRITAEIFDPDKNNVRLLVRWSTKTTFSPKTDKFSGWVTWHKDGRNVNVDITGLSQNTHYYVRLYAQDSKGRYSTGYNSLDFWTNRASLPPTNLLINSSGSGMTLPVLSSATFSWVHNDPDKADYQTGFQIQYRTSATSSKPASAWTTVTAYPGAGANLAPKVDGPPTSSRNQWVFNPGTFRGNAFYEWQVRTRDGQALWGAFSDLSSFYSSSTNTPPTLVAPGSGDPVVVEDPTTFAWRFVDPDTGDVQHRADIRWRALGDTKQIASGSTLPVTVGAAQTPYKVIVCDGAQDFAYDEEGDTWYLSWNSAGTYPVEDNRVQRLNANGTFRDFMTVRDIGHGMPLDVETVGGTTYVTLAYYHRPAPSYFEKFVRLPYVPGKVYTLAEALTYEIAQPPNTEYPPTPPGPEGLPLQGWCTKDGYEYRLYDDPNAYPEQSGFGVNGVSRIDTIFNDQLVRTMYFPKAGYNADGSVTSGRRESEGLHIHMVGGVPVMDFGVVTGSPSRGNTRYRIYRLAMEGGLPVPPDWITLLGANTPGVPAGSPSWTVQDHTFVAGYTYEWQVRTYDSATGLPSGWSSSFRFHALTRPGAEGGPLPVGDVTRPQGSLGCGTYRVFIYEQGGQKRIGEVTPVTRLAFNRVRDDISGCTLFTSGYSVDCGALYAATRCWMHELVVFRDGVRVWEGPITRIGYSVDTVEIEAKDVMAYVYRRVMRVGYNDAYRLLSAASGSQPAIHLGLLSVVRRAGLLITQALAPYDPNVLPYLTAIEYPDDAQEARVVADWSRSCWEEVDDLAATAGLDYTALGRRIILWDTHRALGRLPEMRDGDFGDSPIVTEYGMQLATFFAVTNGSGIVGTTEVAAKTVPYGPIEQLASSYSDSTAAAGEVLTPAALAAAQRSMVEQAKRNIAGRWPAPLIVRIPDNTTLSPSANVGFQQLVPGVWLPLRSVNTPRQVTQWQKLDSIGVEVEGGNERVHVVFSPAPNGGNDPDAEQTVEG